MRTFGAILLAVVFSGCIQTIAIRTVGGILNYGLEAFNEEEDFQLAHEALGSDLKLIEALIKGDPGNEQLLLMASQGFSAYALAFVEDDSAARARLLYRRGRDYGLQILDRNAAFRTGRAGTLQEFTEGLKALSEDDVPAVFWTSFGWAGYVNLSRTDLEAVADLPRINAMMEFVLQHEPSYYYAGAHLYMGTILGSTPAMIGGSPERSNDHFEQCLALTRGRFLLAYVYYAQTYAVQVQNRELFDSLLTKVEETSLDILPEARLPNAVAKRKAQLLLGQANDLF